MNVRAVIFDLGHTLWDLQFNEAIARETYQRAHAMLAEAIEGPIPSLEELRRAVEQSWEREETDVYEKQRLDQRPAEDLVREALAGVGLEAPARVLGPLTRTILSPDVFGRVVEAETVGALGELAARGLLLGVVSNTYQFGDVLRAQIAASDALRLLGATIFSSEMGLRKPHAALFEAALGELGVPAEAAVFVGDSPRHDIEGAKGVGMRAVLTRQYRQPDLDGVEPDHVIKRLPEVIPYVDRLNAG